MPLAVKPNQLKLTFLCAGVIGMALRAILYATAVDEKGLLLTGHWTEICVWILTATAALGLFLLLRKCGGPKQYDTAFPASPVRAAGCILAACAFLLSGAPEAVEAKLAVAELVLRFVSAAALIAVGYCRLTGRKPFFLFHGAVCLYLALRMVCRYRLWCADPQLQDYCFSLGAYVALMLTAYQFAAFDTDEINHRQLWICGLSAVYLCMLALVGSEPFLMLCCGIWVLTNLSCLSYRKPAYLKEGD